jgi:hypothetical protein
LIGQLREVAEVTTWKTAPANPLRFAKAAWLQLAVADDLVAVSREVTAPRLQRSGLLYGGAAHIRGG